MDSKCIICFLNDINHKEIRSHLHNAKHISQLHLYKQEIIKLLNDDIYICSDHLDYDGKKYVHQIIDVVKSCNIEIIQFIDEIIATFEEYIKGYHSKAYIKIEQILDKLDLTNEYYDHNRSNFQIFFRTRKYDSMPYTDKMDLFHIPFTQLFNVTNQRYSSSGHPFLYIGRSLITLEKELEIMDLSQYSFSCFILKDWRKFKYFRFYNTFEHRFNSIKGDSTEDIEKIENKFDTLKAIYRFLLVQFCSFTKKNLGSFSEEYVLPQLIIEYLKNEQFNGIMYKSTKDYDFYKYPDYMYNLVLFTEYSTNDSDKYDLRMMNSFEISVPIKYNNNYQITKSEIDRLIKEKYPTWSLENNDIFNYVQNSSKIRYQNNDYLDTELGKFQNYILKKTLGSLN